MSERLPGDPVRENPIRYLTERDPPDDLLADLALFAEYDGGRRERVRQVVYHSPTGIEYGYGGSGPADMALTILAHFYELDPVKLAKQIRTVGIGHEWDESERRAVRWHQEFKWKHVASANRAEPLIVYWGDLVRFVADQLQAERT
jgi:hypothetical protein